MSVRSRPVELGKAAPSTSDRVVARLTGYLVAAGAVAVALLVSLSLHLDKRAPYLTFYPAVATTALACGLGPGLLASILSAAAVAVWIRPEVIDLTHATGPDLLSFLFFCAMAVFLNVIVELYHRGQDRLAAYEAALAAHERKQAEDALQTTLQRFHIVLSSMYSGVLLVGMDGKIEFANPALCDRFNLPDAPADLIGLDAEAMVAKIRDQYQDPEASLARIREILACGEPVTGEEVAMYGGGTCLRDFVPLTVQGKPYGRLWLHTDITDRKRAEEAVRESEQTFAAAFANNPAGIAMTRLDDGVFLDVNDTWVDMTGFSREEVVGRSSLTLHIWPSLEERERYARELQEKGLIRGWLQDFHRKSGEIYVVQLSAAQLTIRGTPVVLSTLVDVTEHRRTEQKLRLANQDLESFSYSVSHDLRAPLRGIAGFSGLLQEACAERRYEDVPRLAQDIEQNAMRMSRLIDDLLQFAKVGRSQIELAPVDAASLVREAWDEIKAGAADRRVELRVHPLPDAVGDRNLLRQVFANLLGNAMKYTGRRSEALIEVGGDLRDGVVRYYVRDNGVGFKMEHAQRIFEVFQRLHHEDEFPGSGVGLASVRRIVKRHGGDVHAEGTPDKGATFSFTLPQRAEGMVGRG